MPCPTQPWARGQPVPGTALVSPGTEGGAGGLALRLLELKLRVVLETDVYSVSAMSPSGRLSFSCITMQFSLTFRGVWDPACTALPPTRRQSAWDSFENRCPLCEQTLLAGSGLSGGVGGGGWLAGRAAPHVLNPASRGALLHPLQGHRQVWLLALLEAARLCPLLLCQCHLTFPALQRLDLPSFL